MATNDIPVGSDDSKVVAWRLTQVESSVKGLDDKLQSSVKGLDDKLDRVINEYPTHTILANLLEPINREIRDLKAQRREEETDKVKHAQQLKLAVTMAFIGPAMTFIVTLILANSLGKGI